MESSAGWLAKAVRLDRSLTPRREIIVPHFFAFRSIEAMAGAIPSAQLKIFEHYGHMSTVEAPAALSGALVDLLSP